MIVKLHIKHLDHLKPIDRIHPIDHIHPMEIAFALLVLALIILGLRNRKKEKKEWIKEERYDERGAWIDKRSGERGTYGSLDEEMEATRQYIARQSKVSELALAVQSFCFAQHDDFQNLSNEKKKKHLAFCKSEIAGLFEQGEELTNGRSVSLADTSFQPNALRSGLKKLVLDFSFDRFPKLLELEIEQIQQFDLAAEQMSNRVLAEIDRLST